MGALAAAAAPEAQIRKVIKEELNDIKDEIRELISADIGQTTHEQPRALGLRGLEGPPKWAKELDEQNLDEDSPDPFARGSADPEPGESSGSGG